MTKKKIFGWICGILAGVLIVAVIGAWSMFGNFIKAARSIEKLEDGLYSMEFSGDYGLDEFLAKGGADSDSGVADFLTSYLSHGFYKKESNIKPGNFGCSAVCLSDNDGTVYFGRNYDWAECNAVIVHTKPKNGYESVSTCCLDFLGFGEGYVPNGSMMERFQTLAAIYVPLDGMNEKGLMIADLMAGDNEETHQNTDKPDLTTTTAIRLLLDRAANVDEALDLLSRYDMNSSVEAAHHLAIADADGKSVVVEYVNGEMLVAETKVVTNHYLCSSEKQGIGSEQSHIRFDTLSAWNGTVNETAVKELLKSVAQRNYPQSAENYEKTMWSIVYIPAEMRADFFFAENYEHSYRIMLGAKSKFIVK